MTMSRLLLSISKNGDSTTPLGNLLPWSSPVPVLQVLPRVPLLGDYWGGKMASCPGCQLLRWNHQSRFWCWLYRCLFWSDSPIFL